MKEKCGEVSDDNFIAYVSRENRLKFATNVYHTFHSKGQISSPRTFGTTLVVQKIPRADKNKLGTSNRPLQKKTYPPPPKKNEEFYGHGGLPAERTKKKPGAHKIGAAIADPRIEDGNTTDMRLFQVIKVLGRMFLHGTLGSQRGQDIPDLDPGMSQTEALCTAPLSVAIGRKWPACPAIWVGTSRDSQGPLNGAFPNLDLSFLLCLFLSFLGLFRFFWDFPICPGTLRGFSRFVLFFFPGLLTAPTRNSPGKVCNTIWTFPEKSGNPPPLGLASPKIPGIWLRTWGSLKRFRLKMLGGTSAERSCP